MSAPKRTKQGDKGDAVKAWQEWLMAAGYMPGVVRADGIHGPGTEKASLAYEASLKRPVLVVSAAHRFAIDAVLSIFETGRLPSPGAYATCSILADGAGISYGKHQCTDKGGALDLVVKRYIELGGQHAAALAKYQPQLAANASAAVAPKGPYPTWLTELIALLKTAGADPVMQQAQDEVFDEEYFAPAVERAGDLGLTTALGLLTIYDTCIHSGPGRVASHVKVMKEAAPKAGGDERKWVAEYIAVRRAWLAASSNPLVQKCVYRQDALTQLIAAGKWGLELPLVVRGITIDNRALA